MGVEKGFREIPWMADCLVSRERLLELDLESGGSTNQVDRTNDVISANRQTRNFSSRNWSGPWSFLGWMSSQNYARAADENGQLLLDKNSEGEKGEQQMAFADKKHLEENPKKKNSRKAPKPPKPPKGPLLDAADQMLVKELTEIAMRKRARIERIKALKKLRQTKASSWNSSLIAMVITVLFCIVIIFQGICPRDSGSMLLHGSPEPAVAGGEDLISLQFYKNSAYETDAPGYSSSNFVVEPVSGSGIRKR